MSDVISKLNRRYATKKFDSTKKISESDLKILFESLRLSPSSFGLQPWKFIHVKSPEIREKLKEHSWGQSQVTDASDLIVIAVKNTITKDDVDEFTKNIVETRAEEVNEENRKKMEEGLQSYQEMILNTVGSRTSDQIRSWNQKQAYIAMGLLLTVCAEIGIDSCPMEGFDPIKYNEILGLDKLGFTTTLVIPVGYRSSEDKYASMKKVRFPMEKIMMSI